MNAPRQGLYATLLAISYALHTALIVEGAVHQLATTRDAQGQLLIRQLAEDAATAVARQDTVALALLANRYSQRADVVSLRILAADGHVLATGGNAPSRDGQLFQQIIVQDRTQAGQVELNLAEASPGEVVRLQWLPLLLSLLIHVFLWLFYRVAARPRAGLVYAEEAESHITATTEAAAHEPAAQPVMQMEPNSKALPASSYATVMRIAFDDPRNLLDTLSPNTSQKYFSLCQTILENAIRHIGSQMPSQEKPIKISIVESFGAQGALVGVQDNSTLVLSHLIILAQLINVLSDAVYRRHRSEKRFALHTRVVVSEGFGERDAASHSTQLLAHAATNEVLIHAANQSLSRLIIQFRLTAVENIAAELGETMKLAGLRPEQAQIIERAREQILGATTSPA